jgi:hypothetical protein
VAAIRKTGGQASSFETRRSSETRNAEPIQASQAKPKTAGPQPTLFEEVPASSNAKDEGLSAIVQGRPELGPAKNALAMGSAELLERVAPITRAHVVDHHYDTLDLFIAFAAHFRIVKLEHPQCSASEALSTFSYDSKGAAAQSEHGHSFCSGLAADLIDQLRDQGLSSAMLVGCEIPGNPIRFPHAAAVVPFENPNDSNDRGVLLLDPGRNLAMPLVITPDQTASIGTGGFLNEFKLVGDSDYAVSPRIEMNTYKKKGSREPRHPPHRFLLQELKNADETLNRGLIATTAAGKLVARQEDGQVAAAIVIGLGDAPENTTVTFRIGKEREDIPAQDLEAWKSSVSEEFAALFGMTQKGLIDKISAFVESLDVVRMTRDELRNKGVAI